MLAMRAWNRDSSALAFFVFSDTGNRTPFGMGALATNPSFPLAALCLRDRLRDRRFRRLSNALCGLGPTTFSPVENVANADTPRSTPVAPWFSVRRLGESSVSAVRLTNQRSATRETVADRSLPVKRNDSRIRTHPRLGMRMRLWFVVSDILFILLAMTVFLPACRPPSPAEVVLA